MTTTIEKQLPWLEGKAYDYINPTQASEHNIPF